LQEQCRVCETHGKLRRALEEVRQVLHLRTQVLNRLLLDDFLRPAQSDHMQADTAALQLEQLAQDERL
jgi:hypothetical protein